MNVKKLKEKLSQFPDDMLVMVAERKTDYAYGLVNSVTSKEFLLEKTPMPKKN